MYNQANALTDAQNRLASRIGFDRAAEVMSDTAKQIKAMNQASSNPLARSPRITITYKEIDFTVYYTSTIDSVEVFEIHHRGENVTNLFESNLDEWDVMVENKLYEINQKEFERDI